MARKQRSDSAAAAIHAALSAAAPEIEPPEHVRVLKEHLPFWRGITHARAREEWTKADLVVAAQLARCQYEIERESEQLETEGSLLENQRGTMVMNPRHSVLQQLAQRELALMRSLQIGGVAKGDKRDMQKARDLQRQAEQAREELQTDSLLA